MYRATQKQAEREGRSLHSMNKSEYNAESFRIHDCAQACCLFIQHTGLALYARHGPQMLKDMQLSNSTQVAPIIATIMREPVGRTISAFMHFRCGSARATANMIWDALNKSASVRACAHMHEYATVLETHGLPQYVGVLEARDEFHSLLALELGFQPDSFEGSLPLMVKKRTAEQQLVYRELVESRSFTGWLKMVAPREFFWYEQGVRHFRSWMASYKPEVISSTSHEIVSHQMRFRQQLGLNVRAPFTCPLTPEARARLPQLDWRGSGLGNAASRDSRSQTAFRYCA